MDSHLKQIGERAKDIKSKGSKLQKEQEQAEKVLAKAGKGSQNELVEVSTTEYWFFIL